jgi:hypothetical protein
MTPDQFVTVTQMVREIVDMFTKREATREMIEDTIRGVGRELYPVSPEWHEYDKRIVEIFMWYRDRFRSNPPPLPDLPSDCPGLPDLP